MLNKVDTPTRVVKILEGHISTNAQDLKMDYQLCQEIKDFRETAKRTIYGNSGLHPLKLIRNMKKEASDQRDRSDYSDTIVPRTHDDEVILLKLDGFSQDLLKESFSQFDVQCLN